MTFENQLGGQRPSAAVELVTDQGQNPWKLVSAYRPSVHDWGQTPRLSDVGRCCAASSSALPYTIPRPESARRKMLSPPTRVNMEIVC